MTISFFESIKHHTSSVSDVSKGGSYYVVVRLVFATAVSVVLWLLYALLSFEFVSSDLAVVNSDNPSSFT